METNSESPLIDFPLLAAISGTTLPSRKKKQPTTTQESRANLLHYLVFNIIKTLLLELWPLSSVRQAVHRYPHERHTVEMPLRFPPLPMRLIIRRQDL